MELTDLERLYIEAVRNYHRAYPNGAKQLRQHANDLHGMLMARETYLRELEQE
ncbi:MAG: hypothetical protein Q4A61_00835 [Porphyromonadaceae bacterium]|nr:hypothetical protein [Porphyromonadaceae bacterium]